jgi:hypothetical protein
LRVATVPAAPPSPSSGSADSAPPPPSSSSMSHGAGPSGGPIASSASYAVPGALDDASDVLTARARRLSDGSATVQDCKAEVDRIWSFLEQLNVLDPEVDMQQLVNGCPVTFLLRLLYKGVTSGPTHCSPAVQGVVYEAKAAFDKMREHATRFRTTYQASVQQLQSAVEYFRFVHSSNREAVKQWVASHQGYKMPDAEGMETYISSLHDSSTKNLKTFEALTLGVFDFVKLLINNFYKTKTQNNNKYLRKG